MKWFPTVLLAAALTLIFGLPFREYDTAQLLPIRTLQVEKTAKGVHILSDAGEGTGENWAAAVKNLRENAAGEVFFDTAEQIVFRGGAVVREAVESGDLRPAAQIYFVSELRKDDLLNDYYKTHQSDLSVAELRALYA